MFKGNNQINKIYKGNTLISKVYKGDVLIYPSGVVDENFILQINTALGDGLNQMRMPLQSTQPMTIDWGDGTIETVTQTDLPSTTNWVTHIYANGGIYDIKISNVDRIRFANAGDRLKPLEVLNWGTYGILQAIQNNAFFGANNLTSIADNGDWFDVVTNLFRSFENCDLDGLPADMTLSSLINGTNTFLSNNLTSLPSGMTLSNLTDGNRMFSLNNISTLPSGMTLESLVNASQMFRGNLITSLPSVMTLESLANGANVFLANTLNTDSLSSLYIKMSVLNPNNNVPFHGGSGFYDPNYTEEINGVTYNTGDARADLVARGWTLTDGGSI